MSGAGGYQASHQIAPFGGIDLYASDPALAVLVDAAPHAVAEQLQAHGVFWGSHDALELARLADRHRPELRPYDAAGNRLDMVEHHPAYHALMRRSVAAGLHCSVWDAAGGEAGVRTVARAARLYLTAQTEPGHLAGPAMTNAAIAALAHAPRLAEAWLPMIRSRKYDQSARLPGEKAGALVGVAIAERQAASDLKALTTIAHRDEPGLYRLTGHKWFVSAPMSDGFVTLAQTQEGLSAFLMPRFLPDGTRNPMRIARLKDKLGNHAAATAEIELERTLGILIGEPGLGVAATGEVMTLGRLDSAVISTALMRAALAEAVHHARQRRAYGAPLIAQPMIVRVLADLALDAVAAAALAFRLAESFDRADDDPLEAAFARLMAPVAKYWIGKSAGPLIGEAMESFGANGYVEDSRMPRLYREAPAHALWGGSGNVLCLDMLKVLRKSSEPLEAVLAVSENGLGPSAKPRINALRAATAVALADEGSARHLAEQLALTVAAASLRRSFPAVIGDAFIESRLEREWRSTYGMLDSRFDSRAFVDWVCPPA